MAPSQMFNRWRPHPWHRLETGPEPPERVTAYIEITPFDVVKYEVEKSTGYIRVDRPQRGASSPPTLYGLVPRTYCGPRVAALAACEVADGDPLDICVVSERPIGRGDIIMTVLPIGGIQMIDGGEADDKIVAILEADAAWGGVSELADLPTKLVDRLVHYFGTYKALPGADHEVEIRSRYDRAHAFSVIEASIEDYNEAFTDGTDASGEELGGS